MTMTVFYVAPPADFLHSSLLLQWCPRQVAPRYYSIYALQVCLTFFALCLFRSCWRIGGGRAALDFC